MNNKTRPEILKGIHSDISSILDNSCEFFRTFLTTNKSRGDFVEMSPDDVQVTDLMMEVEGHLILAKDIIKSLLEECK